MRTFFIFLTCLTFGLWAMWARYHYTCKINNLCGLFPGEDEEEDIGPISGLTVTMDGKPVLTGYDHFMYKKNEVAPKLTENNEKFITDLSEYLAKNPSGTLKIGGKYLPSESFKGILETIGLARADHVKKLLVEKGLDAGRLNIDSDPLEKDAELIELLTFEGTSGKVAEELKPEEVDPEENPELNPEEKKPEEKLVVAKFEFTNMTFSDVSFDKGSARFEPVRNFEMYADSVGRYLKDYPDKTLTIIGHTDSDGEIDFNEKLGLQRAQAVKTYFISKHKVQKERIKTETRGEREPVAPNDVEANMRKNRRVNMQIN